MHVTQSVILVLLTSFMVNGFSLSHRNFTDSESSCKNSWKNLETVLGISKITFSDYKYGGRREICRDNVHSCCTKTIEDGLVKLATEQHYDFLIRKNIGKLKSEVIGYSSKFDRKIFK